MLMNYQTSPARLLEFERSKGDVMHEIFLARQPILDRKGNLVAFELLFRSCDSEMADVVDDVHATAQVLVIAFEEMGIADVLGAHRGFINLNAEILHNDLVDLLPKRQVMLELLETVTIDAAIIARCHELKAKGFSLALDDVVELSDDIKPLLSVVEVVKLDLTLIDPDRLPSLVKEFKRYPVKLLAEKVEDRKQARLCMEMGFDLFQGYHFARPEILSGKHADPSRMVLLQLLSMLLSEAENEKIEEAFKEHADLTYNLMRMVNSVGFGMVTKIRSLKHGLVVLGREPLRRWVQLLLYASDKGHVKFSPLMQLAATRGKLLELAAQQERPGDPDYADRAFMVGMLSLLDSLMGEPLPEILARMSLQDEVLAALLRHEGSLGELLALCEKTETGDIPAIQESLLSYFSLTMDTLNKSQLGALAWANSIMV
jgi:EAL and modified HD-GYP domain-containing signal transduction protein